MRVVTRLLVLVFAVAAGPTARAGVSDGPYLFHAEDGSVIAKWVEDGAVVEKRFARRKPIVLPVFAELLGPELRLGKHEPDRATWPMPDRLLAISDVEGQYDLMRRFLHTNGVVDARGRWSFGKGHLVCIGDMVDRGTQVTETLWMLYRLTREATAAGGRVHHVLGNHEVMVMAGDVRYMALKYKTVAGLLEVPPEGLLGADTELGRWLRTRKSLVRVGDYLFVHAGVSDTVASKPVDLDSINEAIRGVIGLRSSKIEDELARMLTGRRGPLWYRGYFEKHAEKYGPVPTPEQLDAILHNVGAKSIVIGHTKVDEVAPMFGKRRVIPIDRPWTDPSKVRGLMVRGRRVTVVDVTGRARDLGK